jgi:dipeptidase E
VRLYLSSYNFGNAPETLSALALDNRRAAIIMNATDVYGPSRRSEYVEANRAGLGAIGFDSDELDLRDYFAQPDQLTRALESYGLVWAVGGNSFVLRRAMAYSGFDRAATARVLEGSLVYAGFSAGAVVATPTLRGLDIDDDPTTVPHRYEDAVIVEGLSLVDYSIAPHYRSDHPESATIKRVVEYFEANRMPYTALRDGQAIVVDGDNTFIAG